MGKTAGSAIFIFLFIFIISFTACSASPDNHSIYITDTETGSNAENSEQNVAEYEEPYRIDVFTMLANYSGLQMGWFGKIVKDKFNMELNLIASNVDGGDVKFTSLLASGDLGDIIVFGDDDSKYLNAISGGLLLEVVKRCCYFHELLP